MGRSLFIIVLRDGVTRKKLLETFPIVKRQLSSFQNTSIFSLVGEYEGNVAVILLLESRKVWMT